MYLSGSEGLRADRGSESSEDWRAIECLTELEYVDTPRGPVVEKMLSATDEVRVVAEVKDP